MGKIQKRHAVWLMLLATVAMPSAAQDAAGGGIVLNFGVEQRLESHTNIGLNSSGGSARTFATTQLSFGLLSETNIDRLSIDTSTSLRVGTGNTETRLDDLNTRFSYRRDVGHADLSVSGRYKEGSIEFTRVFEDFIDADGFFDPPDDLADLSGTGDRTTYALNAELNVMKNGPLSLQFRAGTSVLSYDNATTLSLVDTERYNLGVTAFMRFNEVMDGELSYDFDSFDSEDIDQLHRDTREARFTLGYDYSETVRLTGYLGYTEVESASGIGAARSTRVRDGFTTGLGVIYERPNGAITANIGTEIDENGRRLSYDIGRSFVFKEQTISMSIGQIREDNGETAVTASLNWQRELPTGFISTQLSRGIATNNGDDSTLVLRISANYLHDINDLSNLTLSGSYASEEDIGGGNLAERADLSATYNYSLTPDWALSTGYRYEMRNATTTPSADDHSIFISLGRDFSIRP